MFRDKDRLFRPTQVREVAELKNLTQIDLFALYGIRNAFDQKYFDQFAYGIVTDTKMRMEYEDAYATLIQLSVQEFTQGPARKMGFVMEGVHWPTPQMVLYSADQLALVFGMQATVSEYSEDEFMSECLAVTSDSSRAFSLAQRVLNSVAEYANTNL